MNHRLIGSVPLVLEVTNSDMALIRFHGRNVHGWLDKGKTGEQFAVYIATTIKNWKNGLND